MSLARKLSLFLNAAFMAACAKGTESNVSGWGVKAAAYSTKTLPVCWENRSQADGELKHTRSELSQHVRSQFGLTNLQLVGWNDCGIPSSNDEIRITWWDKGETSSTNHGESRVGDGRIYGNSLANLPQRISGTFKARPTLALNSASFNLVLQEKGRATAIAVMKRFLLHEMGHAVGMLHEHARADSTCDSDDESIANHIEVWKNFDANSIKNSVVNTKNFDERSVMNYCQLFSSIENQVGLSSGDIETINQLYPSQTVSSNAPPVPSQPQFQPPAMPPVNPNTSFESSKYPQSQPIPSQSFVSVAPMGACADVAKVNALLPRLIFDNGTPLFVCTDILTSNYSPVIACRGSFSSSDCFLTQSEYLNGVFVKNRYL